MAAKCTRFYLSVLSLCLKELKAKMKNQARFLVCAARYKLVVVKPALLHHLWSKQNYQALLVHRSDLGQNLCHFLPYIYQKFCSFSQNNLITPNCTHSIQGDRSMLLIPCPWTTTYKNENNIKCFYMEDSIIRQDCSVRSIYSL